MPRLRRGQHANDKPARKRNPRLQNARDCGEVKGMSCGCESTPIWPVVERRLNVFVGSAPSWPVVIADPATCQPFASGIAGSTWTFNVSTAAGVAVLTLSTGSGSIVITDAAASELQIDWTQAQTELLTAGTAYRYELIGQLSTGEIYVALYGTLNARASLPASA